MLMIIKFWTILSAISAFLWEIAQIVGLTGGILFIMENLT